MNVERSLAPVGVWGHLDSLGAAALRAYARRVRELGYGALWVPETVGREPFVTLGALSEVAGPEFWLGTSIASIYARDAVTTHSAAMTLHELTGGRFALGLGVSHPHLVTKVRGHDYGKPVTAMRQHLEAYRVSPYRGPLMHPSSQPPVLIAALREHMLRLAAKAADGAFPYLVTPSRLTWMRAVLDRTVSAEHPRPLLAVTLATVLETDPGAARAAARAYLKPYLRTPNYQASWSEQAFEPEDWGAPGSDRLVDAMVAWGSAGELERRLRQMLEAGADHVALIPLAPDGESEEHLPTLEALAPVLASTRGG